MIPSKLKIWNVLILEGNDQFNPQEYNLPSCMTFTQTVLKQVS